MVSNSSLYSNLFSKIMTSLIHLPLLLNQQLINFSSQSYEGGLAVCVVAPTLSFIETLCKQ